MEPKIVQKENVKHLPEVPERASRQASPGKILEAYWQQGLDRIPTAEKEEAVEQIVQAPKAAESADAEGAETPAELPYDERVQVEGELICSLIREQFGHCKTSEEMNDYLQQIRGKYNLKQAELVDLGTPDFHVRFQVNPLFQVQPAQNGPGHMIYRMEGRTPNPITQVQWETDTLTVGNASAVVGTHMIANPLAPDTEPGTESTTDTDQTAMMHNLANTGIRAVPNAQKYIKGHLLNNNVGGPGQAFNLFPITADANSKHLIFMEKYVKAQLKAHNVVAYEVEVQNWVINPHGATGKYTVDSQFHCQWHLLDAQGAPLGTTHQGDIISTFNTAGADPFVPATEYAGLFNPLNRSKTDPGVIPQANQQSMPGTALPAEQWIDHQPWTGAVPYPMMPSIVAPPIPVVPAMVPAGPAVAPLPSFLPLDDEYEEQGWPEIDDNEHEARLFYDLDVQMQGAEAILDVPDWDYRLSWIEDLINVPLDGSAPLPPLEVGFWFDDHADYGLLSEAEAQPGDDRIRLHLVQPPTSMEIEEVDQPDIFPGDLNFDENDFLT